MQTIRVDESVGTVICHDITRIVPNEFKGPAFKKGHIITRNDIPELLKLGKEHIYVWEITPGKLHENEAAIRLARAVTGQGISLSEPVEGKVSLIAETNGLLDINEKQLLESNLIDEIVIATINNHRAVKKGDIVAAVRVVPLLIDEHKLELVESSTNISPTIAIKPFKAYKVGIVTTGSEVYNGRIKDRFGPVVKEKVEAYGCRVLEQIIVPDDIEQITGAILQLIEQGAEMVLTTGGMSVDPDDVTPSAVRRTGAEIISYGAPVLPGAMMMVAYLNQVPILGLPGCVMYCKTTVFDLLIPSILAGEKVSRMMISRLGMGGLCRQCDVCHFPACSFGTGA